MGPSREPGGLGRTLVPPETHRTLGEAMNLDGKAVARDEATLFAANTVATAFGYEIEVHLALNGLLKKISRTNTIVTLSACSRHTRVFSGPDSKQI